MSTKIRRTSISGTWITLVAIAFAMTWSHAGPHGRAEAATDREEEANRIRILWKQQSKKIVAADFHVILFRYFDSSAQLLSRAEAVRRLKSVGEAANPSTIEPLFDDVAKRGWRKQKSTLWGTPIDVTVDGLKIANTYKMANGKSVHVYDGDSEISYRVVNRQASISAGRSQIEQIDIATIHTVPNHLIAWEESPTVEPTSDGRDAIIRSKGVSARFDRATGFVRQVTQSQDGGLCHEVLQFGPKEVDGVTLAKTVVDLMVENDNIRMMSIYLIDPQSINAAIPAGAFQVSVPANTLIVDHRIDRKSPIVVKTSKDLSDVKRYREVVLEGP